MNKQERNYPTRMHEVLLDELLAEVARLTDERDALESDMYQAQSYVCLICGHYRMVDPSAGEHSKHTCELYGDRFCEDTAVCGHFKWRGLCAENRRKEK